MKELADAFWDIRSREDRLGHRNRVRWGDRIQDYLQCLEYEFFEKPCVNNEDGETYRECNFQENLEALVSFIDLNASGKIEATVADKLLLKYRTITSNRYIEKYYRVEDFVNAS